MHSPAFVVPAPAVGSSTLLASSASCAVESGRSRFVNGGRALPCASRATTRCVPAHLHMLAGAEGAGPETPASGGPAGAGGRVSGARSSSRFASADIEDDSKPDAGFGTVSVLYSSEDDPDEDLEEVEELDPPKWYVNKMSVLEAREKFRLHETDTGSPEYQIAAFTKRITYLTEHLKANPKDYSSTRGLLKLVGKRKRLLRYLKAKDVARFEAILSGMNIRVSRELRAMT